MASFKRKERSSQTMLHCLSQLTNIALLFEVQVKYLVAVIVGLVSNYMQLVFSGIIMEIGDSEDGSEAVKRGGRRRGSGRKRIHESGYKSVQTCIWRSVSIHAELFDEWEELRKRFHFKSNTVFATHLLQLFKSSKGDSNPNASIGCIAR